MEGTTPKRSRDESPDAEAAGDERLRLHSVPEHEMAALVDTLGSWELPGVEADVSREHRWRKALTDLLVSCCSTRLSNTTSQFHCWRTACTRLSSNFSSYQQFQSWPL